MDWDTFFFEYWDVEYPHTPPTWEDYQDWLYDKADKTLGGRDEA